MIKCRQTMLKEVETEVEEVFKEREGKRQ